MALLLAVNFANIVANFAGIAGSLELLPVSRYVSVPAGALLVWVLVVKARIRASRKVFLVASTFYAAYIVSAILVEPDWGAALQAAGKPVVLPDGAYIAMLIGSGGGHPSPRGCKFYLAGGPSSKKAWTASSTAPCAWKSSWAASSMAVIAFFIIRRQRRRDLGRTSPADARRRLRGPRWR